MRAGGLGHRKFGSWVDDEDELERNVGKQVDDVKDNLPKKGLLKWTTKQTT